MNEVSANIGWVCCRNRWAWWKKFSMFQRIEAGTFRKERPAISAVFESPAKRWRRDVPRCLPSDSTATSGCIDWAVDKVRCLACSEARVAWRGFETFFFCDTSIPYLRGMCSQAGAGIAQQIAQQWIDSWVSSPSFPVAITPWLWNFHEFSIFSSPSKTLKVFSISFYLGLTLESFRFFPSFDASGSTELEPAATGGEGECFGQAC